MRKLFLFLLIFCLLVPVQAQHHHRKKVGVVLSGGGAKGVAHVRALKVIEKAGIPIDYIVGTSMGSIVGGLYAVGYTTSQLDSIISSQDWMTLLTDAETRSGKTLSKKLVDDRYAVNLSFDKNPLELIEGGLLKGNNVGKMLSDLTIGYHDSIDFKKLPIPFACVAVDIVKNEEIDFHSGILAECIRASMSIPGVFAPIKKHGKVLVDGGLANNFPVDVARNMGADYVIGVNVGGEKNTADDINTTLDMLGQILNVLCENKFEENKKITDVFIPVDVNGYSSASFTSSAVDTLLVRGENAAMAKWDELLELKGKIGLSSPVSARRNKYIPTDTVVPPIPTIYQEPKRSSQISFGARFDTEELASVLLGGNYEIKSSNKASLGLEARLGRRKYGKLSFSLNPFEKWMLSTSYQFNDNEIKFCDEGKKAGVVTFSEHHGILDLARSWKQILVSVGVDYTYRIFHDYMSSSKWVDRGDMFDENEPSLKYYVSMAFNNQDSKILPNKGLKWNLKYTFYTEDGLEYEDKAGLHIIEGNCDWAIPVSKRFVLQTSLAGRFLQNRNRDIGNFNYLGGYGMTGHYMPQQLAFAGVSYMEMVPNKLLIGGLSGRQWLGKNSYLFEVANYGFMGESLKGFFNTKNIFGAAGGMGYKTPIGPIEANVNWSNLTHSVSLFLNIGYEF